MKKQLNFILAIICFFTILLQVSCKKDWLEAKPKKALVIPTSIKDYQALLDNSNNLFNTEAPGLGEIASDDYYLTANAYQAREPVERNAYVWAKNVYEGSRVSDWNSAYRRILHSNIVLDGIKSVNSGGVQLEWNNVKGSALFFRAFDFFNLAQVFCKTYEPATASTDLGIPLRLTANVNDHSVRASVKQTYDQILADLHEAASLLPSEPLYKTRPSRTAAFGLLARVYLSMSDFPLALAYADSVLKIKNDLLDYNDPGINPSASRPMARYNKEVLFHNITLLYGAPFVGMVDTTLFYAYHINDIRKLAFFHSVSKRFKGSYDGSANFFNGLAIDEMYLIRAECHARDGNIAAAIEDLNILLQKRYKTGTFVPLTATSVDDALSKVLMERRKELCFRGLRWTDLRRLNKDNRFAKTLVRNVNGQTYTLLPNDIKYVFPIPDDEIRISNIEQNPR